MQWGAQATTWGGVFWIGDVLTRGVIDKHFAGQNHARICEDPLTMTHRLFGDSLAMTPAPDAPVGAGGPAASSGFPTYETLGVRPLINCALQTHTPLRCL